MAGVRRRHGKEKSPETSPVEEASDGEEDETPKPVTERTPSGWGVRTKWTLILLGLFAVLIAMGHPALCLLVMVCQGFMYSEIVHTGFKWNKEKELPLFRTLNYFFYVCICSYFYVKALAPFIRNTPFLVPVMGPLVKHANFLVFSGICTGLILFVLTLKKGFYRYQFQQLAWTFMAIFFVCAPATLIMINMFRGLIWFGFFFEVFVELIGLYYLLCSSFPMIYLRSFSESYLAELS
jgi:phosphatidate cytidylyltransferase